MSGKEPEIKAPMIYKNNPFAPLYDLSFAEINLNFARSMTLERSYHYIIKKLDKAARAF